MNVFEICYIDLLKKYLKKGTNKKGHDIIGYNKFYNRKQGTKVSIITDSYGTPISIGCYRGNMNDCRILCDQMKNKYLTPIKHIEKRYFLADLGYDSTFIRNELKTNNYIPLILQKKTVKTR